MQFYIGGQLWKFRAVAKGHPLLEKEDEEFDVMGRTHLEKNIIAVARGLGQGVFEDTYIHEKFGHALLEVSGANHYIKEGKEEDFIRRYIPLLHRLLVDGGYKFPKAPK